MNNDLAKIFTSIEMAASKVEETATKILDAIKEAQADTVADFNEMVGDAYDANGWNRQAGRPSEGSTLKPAPKTIRFYVSRIRKAYEMHLKVMEFETIGKLRQAIDEVRKKEKQAKKAKNHKDDLAALRGVKMAQQEEIIGAEVHDIGVVLKHLDTEGQAEFVLKLQRLIKQYSKRAHLEVAAAA